MIKIEFNFTGTWIAYDASTRGFSKREIFHNGLEQADNTCSITLVPDETLYNYLRGITNNEIPVRVTLDGEPYFYGYVRKTFNIIKTHKLEPLKVEVVSPSFLLKRKIGASKQYLEKTVTEILTSIANDAGIALYSFPAIATVIPILKIEANSKTYHEVIGKMLFEYGYIYDFDASGMLIARSILPATLTTDKNITATNALAEIEQLKVEEEKEKVVVAYATIAMYNNQIVFSDTSGARAGAKCYIELAANSYLGDEEEWYAELDHSAGEVLYANDITLDMSADLGVQCLKLEECGNRVLVSVKNTNTVLPKAIRKFDIIAGTVYLKKEEINKRIVEKVSNTEKVEEITAEYIFDKINADKLANTLAWYYSVSDYTYKVKTKEVFQIGDIVALSVDGIGSQLTRVVEKSSDVYNKVFAYRLEAISEYLPSTVNEEKVVASTGLSTELIESIITQQEEGTAYYRLLTTTTTVKVYPDGTISPDIVRFESVHVQGLETPQAYEGVFKIYIDRQLQYTSPEPEAYKDWIGDSILPQDNLYPSDSLLPVIAFYNDIEQDVQEVYVELYDASGLVRLDSLNMLIIKDISFNQSKIEQTIQQELPKYIGKYKQVMPIGYNRGDWFLIYGEADTPFARGLYKVATDLTFQKIDDDISTNGVYFLSAMTDILAVVKDGYGEMTTYGNITYIENLATNTIMTNYLLGENAQFTGTVRGGTRFNADGSIANDDVDGYVLLPNGNLIASNVELSGAISVDNEYVKKGVFRKDRFYPRSF